MAHFLCSPTQHNKAYTIAPHPAYAQATQRQVSEADYQPGQCRYVCTL